MSNEVLVSTKADNNSLQMFGSKDGFELGMRMAKMFAESTLVPVTFQKNVANCTIGLELASRIGASPLMVMQSLYIVHGKPSFSATFLIGCINASKKFASPLCYEFKGKENTDDWSCRAYAVDHNGETRYGSWVSIRMAKAEGWYSKNGSKWQTMPELMLQYRAATFFQRVYCPEISLGLQTTEEVYDSYEEIPADDTPSAKESQIENEIAENANKEQLNMATPEAIPTTPANSDAKTSEDAAPDKENKPAKQQATSPADPIKPLKKDIPDMFK